MLTARLFWNTKSSTDVVQQVEEHVLDWELKKSTDSVVSMDSVYGPSHLARANFDK
jgi:hypothetical protein